MAHWHSGVCCKQTAYTAQAARTARIQRRREPEVGVEVDPSEAIS